MKKLSMLLMALSLVVSACAESQTAQVTGLVDSARAEQLIESVDDLVVLDVRTPEEFAAGALPGAILVDINGPSFTDEVSELDTDLPYLVYCRSGNRSAAAVEIMEDLGFGEIYELTNGVQAWVASGRQLTTG
ncbi:MAG: rhodanese-like domain-containing protein [Acidimicrobiia bacterium]|nr:rhodanese-like domain-containing protein [Acidimicrobiia bacterium]